MTRAAQETNKNSLKRDNENSDLSVLRETLAVSRGDQVVLTTQDRSSFRIEAPSNNLYLLM